MHPTKIKSRRNKNPNRPVTSEDNEVRKKKETFQQIKAQDQMASLGNSIKHFKKN